MALILYWLFPVLHGVFVNQKEPRIIYIFNQYTNYEIFDIIFFCPMSKRIFLIYTFAIL